MERMAKKSSRKKKSSSTTSSRKGSRLKDASKKQQNRMVFWGLIGLGIMLIIALGAIGYTSSRKSHGSAEGAVTIDERVGQPVNRTTIGDPNAPVLVETYEDFLCPHCAEFTFELGPILMDLVKDGTVRWEYKYRVIGGADSYNANIAAECAADQGKFWEYHEELFRRIADQGKIAVFPRNLKQLAADLGLDTNRFNECLDKKEHLKDVQKVDQLAAARGVDGTPTIFINGQRYDGPRTPDAFRAAIEAAAQ